MNESTEHAEDATNHAATVHVREIVIEGLFGQYTHRIPLAEKGGVAILHGRNGVGKTITLSMISALLSGYQDQIDLLEQWPFDKMRIDFSDNTFVEVRQRTIKSDDTQRGLGRRKAQTRRELDISYPDWLDAPDQISTRNKHGLDATYFGIVSRIKVHYVHTRRLDVETTEDPAGYSRSVTAMSKICGEMVSWIIAANAEYQSTSSVLDDSFAARLFAAPPPAGVDADDLERRNEALERERKRLQEIGLLAKSKTSFRPDNLDTTKQAMFAVYLEDNEKKLAVFKDLADRAELLLNVLNSKLAPKRVRLDNTAGYRVYSHDHQPLQLDWLSSGEQHELILLHNLLFHVEPGSLLLIDEPEISLHVTWQNEFLEDLVRIAKKIGFDAIAATHSPYIVGKRRDLMVQLGAPE